MLILGIISYQHFCLSILKLQIDYSSVHYYARYGAGSTIDDEDDPGSNVDEEGGRGGWNVRGRAKVESMRSGT